MPMETQTPLLDLSDLQAIYGGEIANRRLKGAVVAGQECSIYIGGGTQIVVDGTAGTYTPQQIGAFLHIERGLPLPPYAANAVAKLPVPKAANDNEPSLDIFAWKSSRFVGEPPPVQYLVEGVIESGIPAMIAAMGELGKSYSLLELCRRIAFGSSALTTPIFGGQVVQEGTAVFLTGEDNANAIHRRLAAIDSRGARFAEKGDKLLTIPLPSAVATFKPYWVQDKGVMRETDEWRRFIDQLGKVQDLRAVVIDPLQMFAAVPINEDPAAGQFVCGSIATLAAQTGANVFFAHHMKKPGRDPIRTLSDARDAIRGTSALVDGVRLAYALWYPEIEKSKAEAKTIGTAWSPNTIVHGGVVKANGAARRMMSTYARSPSGLLIDRTALLGSQGPSQDDAREALVIAIEAAARSGQPFTRTGASGLFALKERLPEELSGLSRHKLETLAGEALQAGKVVACIAKGSTVAKWLDVPTGYFASGLGEFRQGMQRSG